MARGSAVIPYHGKRGTVWRIKYADADGRQVMETLGLERDGWTRTKAQRALGAREAEVARGMRKPPTDGTLAIPGALRSLRRSKG